MKRIQTHKKRQSDQAAKTKISIDMFIYFFFFSFYFCPFIAEFALQEITLLLLKRCLHSAPIFFKIMYAITVCAHKFLHNLFVQLVAFYCDEIFFLFFITQRMRRFFVFFQDLMECLKNLSYLLVLLMQTHHFECTMYSVHSIQCQQIKKEHFRNLHNTHIHPSIYEVTN